MNTYPNGTGGKLLLNSDKILFRLELPVPMPTTNRVLGMNQWQRKKLRDWFDAAVRFMFTSAGSDYTTPMDASRNTSWMQSFHAAYYKTMGLKLYSPLPTRRKKQTQTKL